jgi:hypothetical protein
MSYNLNFYPNGYNQPEIYNPYRYSGFNNQYTQQTLKEAENKLHQMQNQINPNSAPQNQQKSNNPPYYLYCGDKDEWDEFLMLNYGITEQAIFDDYKLFLQAKQELLSEQGQNKIDFMKDKIRNKDKGFVNVDSSVKSNIKPKQSNNINRGNNGFNMGDSGESNNGFMAKDKQKPKNTDKQ